MTKTVSIPKFTKTENTPTTAPTPEWTGTERRMHPMHFEPLAECVERNKYILEKLSGLVDRFDRINGRYDTHLVESITYRTAVDMHTKRFDSSEKQTQWIIGLMAGVLTTMVMQVVTFAFLWGSLTKRVEVNTDRLAVIETDTKVFHTK